MTKDPKADDEEGDSPAGQPSRRLAAMLILAVGVVLLCLWIPEAAGGIATATGVLLALHQLTLRK